MATTEQEIERRIAAARGIREFSRSVQTKARANEIVKRSRYIGWERSQRADVAHKGVFILATTLIVVALIDWLVTYGN